MADEFTTGNLYLGSGTNVSDTEFDIRLSTEDGLSTLFNASGSDIDFRVNASGKVGLHVDSDTGRVGIGTGNNIGAALHVVSTCANDGLRVETRTDCPTGVQIEFIHKPQTPPINGSLPVQINLAGRDDNSNDVNYSRIKSRALSTETANTTGELVFTVIKDGVDVNALVLNPLNSSIGTDNLNSGNNYLFIGNNNHISGSNFIVFGNGNSGIITSGILLGADNVVSGDRLLVIADDSIIDGDNNIVFALDSEIYGDSNLVMAENVLSSGDQNIVLGHNYNTTGSFNILLLNDSDQFGSSGVGFGNQVSNSGSRNVYVGNFNTLQGDDCLIVGSEVEATGDNNILYGSTSSLSGNSIISIGAGNQVLDINSGVFIGSNIDLSDGEKSVVIGLGNTTENGLTESILLGIDNTTTDGSPTGVIVIGQDNRVSVVKNTTIVGNSNEASGTVLNNVIYGTLNSTPLNSRNNVIVGVMNNTSGNILSDGSVDPSGRLPDSTMVNSVTYGVNNIVSEISGTNLIGSKTYASGQNINSLGSLNQLKQCNNGQVLGHSNFMVGEDNTIVGSYNDIIGTHSIMLSSANYRNQLFGSGNISIGNSEAVISGMTVGFQNNMDAPYGVVYGTGNQVGLRRNRFTINNDGSSTVLSLQGDQRAIYIQGGTVLLAVLNPSDKDKPVVEKTIGSVIYNNAGPLNDTTSITINTPIIPPTDAPNYAVNNFFDDPTYMTGDSAVISGWILPLQSGSSNPADTITNPRFGFGSIILGNNNTSMHASGLIFGQNNAISGSKHIVIGNDIQGFYNDSVQIGTNNTNKLFFDDDQVVFNTGGQQDRIVFNTSIDTVEDDPVTTMMDLNNNRVGINVNNPSTTLDVSGIISARGLKLYGDNSNISGWIPVNTGDGTVSWQEPVTLSGINSGMVMKVSDTVGSGLTTFAYNEGTQSILYNRSDTERNDTFLLEAGDDAVTAAEFNPLGLYLNQPQDLRNYGYKFVVYGSGTTDSVNNTDGTNNVYLLNTITERNEVQMTNFTGISGAMRNLWADTSINAPASLTGTFLYVDNTEDNALLSKTVPTFSTLFAMQTHWQSGDRGFRYYPEDYGYVVTIGSTGTQVELDNGYSDVYKSPNIVLSSSRNYGSTFNAAGSAGTPFRIIQSGLQTDLVGLQYNCQSGILGLNVADNGINAETYKEGDNTDSRIDWYKATQDNCRLLVNGKARLCGLQITQADGRMPGVAQVDKYLKVVDADGNIDFADVVVTQDFDADWPLAVNTTTLPPETTYSIATEGAVGTAYGAVALSQNQAGIGLFWNGADWTQGIGQRFSQPPSSSPANVYASTGVSLGPYATYFGINNQFVLGGQPVAPLASITTAPSHENWLGSAQETLVQLKTITQGADQKEAISNFDKQLGYGANINEGNVGNTINLILNEEVALENEKNLVWRIEIDWVGMVQEQTVGSWAGITGKYRGGLLSYFTSNQRNNEIFEEENTHTKSSNISSFWSSSPLSINVDASNRLVVAFQGESTLNVLWSAHVRCIQTHLPKNVVVAGNGV